MGRLGPEWAGSGGGGSPAGGKRITYGTAWNGMPERARCFGCPRSPGVTRLREPELAGRPATPGWDRVAPGGMTITITHAAEEETGWLTTCAGQVCAREACAGCWRAIGETGEPLEEDRYTK